MGDAQAGGDADLAGLDAVADQVRDQFDVVLHQLHAMRLADLAEALGVQVGVDERRRGWLGFRHAGSRPVARTPRRNEPRRTRSEEHTSELQSLMRISYAVFCLKKKKHNHKKQTNKPYRELTEHNSTN